MANIYTSILTGTMDGFASVISNNLNIVMKRLAVINIIVMIPTVVYSLFGMNVSLPLQHEHYAWVFIIVISFFISAVGLFIITWYDIRAQRLRRRGS
jgi:magnesium transporter